MRVYSWILLIGMFISLACQGCRPSIVDSRNLTPERRATIENEVKRFTAVVAHDVTTQGPIAWRTHFADTSAFFMAVNGSLVFPDGNAAANAIPEIASKFKRIELRWGDDLRFDVLTENLCVVAGSYIEDIDLKPGAEGPQGKQSGYFTGLAENRHGQWQFRDAHWSASLVPMKTP